MRALKKGKVLAVRAIGGLHVVTVAWDFVEGQEAKRKGLLGFALERSEFKGGKLIERFFVRGIKRFKKKDEGLPPGTPMPTSEHPIQTFQWGDYTAKPKTTYQYKVVPVYGTPKLIELDEKSATTVEITTEPEQASKQDQTGAWHDIYFNRGAAGSQAYARRFPDVELDENDPESEPMVWLSRGLFEALIGFIKLAAGKDARQYRLRAMLYEFRYLPVGEAFAAAARKGADVQIRYEAQSYKKVNQAMIAKAKIKKLCKPQKSRSGIRHNKFIVLIKKGKGNRKDTPVAVWTGSTNISPGGIFGHSNVGHVIWDKDVAQRYLDYWERLADPEVKPAALREANLEAEPTPERKALPPKDRMLTLFSLRDEEKKVPTLRWFGDMMAAASRIMCMSFAFNLDDILHKELVKKNSDTLRYAVFDKNPGAGVEGEIRKLKNAVIAPGAKLEKADIVNFLAENLSGLNRNLYIHDKFLLIDPLGDDPIVITGSANFSKPSQVSNDENMLVIRGNTRVADIYFGEFMRIFDHLYSRYVIRKIRKSGKNDPDAGFLKEDPSEWVPSHFRDGPKKLRRLYFMDA
jgi:phosphatidylserine/phosphatidylglycerophosphate/cardiolipin synthase-like enzyme